MLFEISQSNFQRDILDAEKIVVVDFYATWCGPCRMLIPILEELAEENPDVRFFTVNVDDASDLAGLYEIRNLPTLLIFKEGNVVARNVGAATKFEIEDLLLTAKDL
ncbi:MAG: thioredoxin [Holosporales bacterium]|jgi:thioredoxin 1|nr:thioredoxin [Holosporales bacterium]